MASLVLKAKQYAPARSPPRVLLAGGMVLAVAIVTQTSAEFRNIVLQSLSDAYLQVSVFVAATLALFYVLERLCHIDMAWLLDSQARWQLPVAALLGA